MQSSTSSQQASPPAAPAFGVQPRWSRNGFLFVLACTLLGLLTLSRNKADVDLWGHVQYGKEVLRNGVLPEFSTWNYTTHHYAWVNHNNLAELAFGAVDGQFGASGLLLLKVVVSLALMGCIIWRLRARGTQPLTIGVVVLLVTATSAFHWQFRPQIFGYLMFALMLALLDWCFEGWAGDWWLRRRSNQSGDSDTRKFPGYSSLRMKGLYALIPLTILWVNTDGGFASGIVIACAYLGLRGVESLCIWGSSGWGRVRRFALMSFGIMLAMLFTPYGFQLPLRLIENFYHLRTEFADWDSLQLMNSESIGFWGIVLTTLLATIRTRKIDFTHAVLLLLLLVWQGASHSQHTVLLAIAWAFWMAGPIDQMFKDLAEEWAKDHRRWELLRIWNTSAVAAVLTLWMGTVGWLLWPAVTRLEVDRSKFPVAAMQYMAEHDLSGRTVVTSNWSQYAIGCFDAAQMPSTVAFDGRLRAGYPQEVIDIYLDFIANPVRQQRLRTPESPALNRHRALEHLDPTLVLISRAEPNSVEVMQEYSDTWVLLYQDSIAQVWGQRDLFDNPDSPRFLPKEARHVSEDLQTGVALWPALPQVNRQPIQIVSAPQPD
ncbi:MAG: hypothetical protein R3C18_00630 [Planctomycetaceae bacterium]